MKKIKCLFYLLFFFIPCFAQQENNDSLKTLDEITVRAFEQNRSLKSTTANIRIIDLNNADRYNKTSLVNSFNTVAGVRMEERSPGSYRINIRGSSLRSPFGVRNVKVYWNDIPVTDPGGNTYFNQFAYNNFSFIEIFKGPAGSMYGSGTGGLILMQNLSSWQPGITAEYVAGSYGLNNMFGSFRFGKNENKNQITFSHNQNDGYREQSKMRRNNFSWTTNLKVTERQQLSASLLFTDMNYQTPGALTLAEYIANPKSARPAAGGFPSAINARAAINQLNVLAGFTHRYKISPDFTNTITFYGSFAEIKNPAIRNYERRYEPSFGNRTVFIYEKKKEHINWQLTGGGEFQHGFFNTTLFKNVNGQPDSLQTSDDIIYKVNSYFIQGDFGINDHWFFNGGISINKTRVSFSRSGFFPATRQKRSYQNEFAPRLSMKKILTDNLFLKATVSRGFSPPTIAELLPSTGVISTNLEAEYGWTYEMTAGYDLFKRKLRLEATGFYFKLNNALVQRRDISGADFFVNAGNVKQKGLEFSADYSMSVRQSFLDYFILKTAYTCNHFHYGDFKKGTDDFSGKIVPSVPANIFSALADFNLKIGLYANITYYTASEIFLNDANTATADPYHLLGLRLGFKKMLKKKNKINCYAGIDNLLDETYSLGNDINAAANRFYNAAPRRNFYIGLSFQWIKPKKD